MRKFRILLIVCLMLLTGCSSESEKYMELADKYFADGHYDYAAYNYIRVLETDRDNEKAYMNLIDSYIAQGKLNKALEYLQDAEIMFGEEDFVGKRNKLDILIAEENDNEMTNELSPSPTHEPTVTPMEDVETSDLVELTATPVPIYTFIDIDLTAIVLEQTAVYKSCSLMDPIIDCLYEGDIIVLQRQCNENGWYEFVHNGNTGYSSGREFYIVEKEEKTEEKIEIDESSKEETLFEGKEIDNLNFTSTFKGANFTKAIKPDNTNGAYIYYSCKDDEIYLDLTFEIKNIANYSKKMENLVADVILTYDNKYIYSGCSLFYSQEDDISEVYSWDKLDPLEKATFHIAVKLPEEVANTNLPIVLKFSFMGEKQVLEFR